jgi:hypothetical protein
MQWRTGVVEEILSGRSYWYTFQWLEPLGYLERLVADPSLAPHSHWNAVQKWLVEEDGTRHQVFNEPWTAGEWGTVQVPSYLYMVCKSNLLTTI